MSVDRLLVPWWGQQGEISQEESGNRPFWYQNWSHLKNNTQKWICPSTYDFWAQVHTFLKMKHAERLYSRRTILWPKMGKFWPFLIESLFGHSVGFPKTKKRNDRPITYSRCLFELLLGLVSTQLLKHREKMAISFKMTVDKQDRWIATSYELHLLGQLKLPRIRPNVPQNSGNKKLSLSQTSQNYSMRMRNLNKNSMKLNLVFSFMKKKRNFACITFFLSFWFCLSCFLLNSCSKEQEKILVSTSNRPPNRILLNCSKNRKKAQMRVPKEVILNINNLYSDL